MGIHLMAPLFKIVMEGGGTQEPDAWQTFYPDALYPAIGTAQAIDLDRGSDAGSSQLTWAQLHDAGSADALNNLLTLWLKTHETAAGKWKQLNRVILAFATVGLPAKVVAAKLRLKLNTPNNQFAATPSLAVYGATPANPGNITVSDFATLGTSQLSNAVPWSDIVGNQWREFNLTREGLALVKEGVSTFSVRISWDAENSPPAWAADKVVRVKVWWDVVNSIYPELLVGYLL